MVPKPNDNPKFVPFPTMFKLQTETTEVPRAVECVNCSNLVVLKFYCLGPSRFDKQCEVCGMSAEDYWKNKRHSSRKVEDQDA